MSGRGRTGSGKGWTSELCGRWGLLRGGELLLIPATLRILFSVWWIWLCLAFRPERLRLLRPRRFSWLLGSLKSRRSRVRHFLLLLHWSSNWWSCQEPLLLGLKIALGNFLNLLPNRVLEFIGAFRSSWLAWNIYIAKIVDIAVACFIDLATASNSLESACTDIVCCCIHRYAAEENRSAC